MAVTRKPNPAYFWCFSRWSLLKLPSLSADVFSASSQSCCITWRLMRKSGLPESTLFKVDLRSPRWAISFAWTSTERSASATPPTLRWVRPACVVLLPAVSGSGCPLAGRVLDWSLLRSHDPEHSHHAVLICDTSYLLLWSVCLLFLFICVVFG